MPEKVKITILKKLDTHDIFHDVTSVGEPRGVCSQFDVGQEFVINQDGGMPEGFCHWAWNDIYKVVTTLRYGGNFSGKTSIIRCCTDGLRPVFFEIKKSE